MAVVEPEVVEPIEPEVVEPDVPVRVCPFIPVPVVVPVVDEPIAGLCRTAMPVEEAPPDPRVFSLAPPVVAVVMPGVLVIPFIEPLAPGIEPPMPVEFELDPMPVVPMLDVPEVVPPMLAPGVVRLALPLVVPVVPLLAPMPAMPPAVVPAPEVPVAPALAPAPPPADCASAIAGLAAISVANMILFIVVLLDCIGETRRRQDRSPHCARSSSL